MIKKFLLFFLLNFSYNSYSQTEQMTLKSSDAEALIIDKYSKFRVLYLTNYNINLDFDIKYQNVLNKYLSNQKNNNDISYFRIMIYSGTDRNIAEETYNNFKKKMPFIKAFFEYDFPNYKVTAGNNRNKFNCQKLYLEIKKNYSRDCYIVYSKPN